jgi:hypothetical protein
MNLPEQTAESRLNVYRLLTSACTHLYSKNKLQADKMKEALKLLYPLTQDDPYFLAHLAAWSARGSNQSRDIKLLAVYLNAMSAGDGTPFVKGGTLRKPNLRLVSHALFGDFDPKQFARLASFRRLKWSPNEHPNAVHFPRSLREAMERYLNSLSLDTLNKHLAAGFRRHLIAGYRLLQVQPPNEMAALLRYKQKNVPLQKAETANPFAGLTDQEIAEKIERERIPFSRALSMLEREPSPLMLSALFEVASGNQLIVQLNLFEKAGLLSIPEFAERFYAKIKHTATTSVDRLDTVAKGLKPEIKEKLQEVRAETRQTQLGKLDGKLHLDIDKSGSMSAAIALAKECAAVLCDVVGAEDFTWGLFDSRGYAVKDKPITKEHAHRALFGVAADGSTDCFANYRAVMAKHPVQYYIWITDEDHNHGSMDISALPKPEVAIIVHAGGRSNTLSQILRRHGIEPVPLKPEALKESALVVQAIKTALRGQMAIIDEIMAFPLPVAVD